MKVPHIHSNRLCNETSPYLLQHANNPVDWYPWGPEALQRAKKENKIILISIGYAACHWCHVMEKESFEDSAVAAFMNENFINIKIDREERPDLDHIYMDAVQAMTGAGGWPLNVFLTPDTRPFYGGTYFPPIKAYNRPSWIEVLGGVKTAWEQREDEIITQAENLVTHLQKSGDFGMQVKSIANAESDAVFTKEHSDIIFKQIMKTADTEWGGFGNAPKFPQIFTIQYLLQYYHFTGNQEALQQARLSIDKILEGGIYDHVGGGMARYSTDSQWLVPHFEKMLYDNALLINVLSDVYLLTKDKYYEKAMRKTIGFAVRELMDPKGGFYAAIDADSEGEEGKFYIWDKEEIETLLGDDSLLFCEFFGITKAGNWVDGVDAEGTKNILHTQKKAVHFAAEKGLDPFEFNDKIDALLDILLTERNKRIRPITDDKILLSWNSLMTTALCKAAAALNDEGYRELAEKNFKFLLDHFRISDEGPDMNHTYKNKVSKFPAFLDDYAFLIQSCIYLQEITSEGDYLLHANALTSHVILHFNDEATGYFFYTHNSQKDVIVRKKEVYDGAIPSSNGIMAENLFYLSVVFNKPEWSQLAQKITRSLQPAVLRYPGSFGIWASLLLKQLYGINEIVISGKNASLLREALLFHYIPNKVLQCSTLHNIKFPLLKDKEPRKDTLFYLCKNYSCQPPVKELGQLLLLINKLTV